MIQAVSLFTGAGGMDIGFEQAGVNVVMANELDKTSAQTFSSNHPEIRVIVDDINNIFSELSNYTGVDLVFGGPPCQGFSVIGKMNPDDERSKLIWSFLKAVETIKPRAFIMENVKALAYISKWKDIRESFIRNANEIGYGCFPYLLNAVEYGTPQKRERVFFVGIRGDYSFREDVEKRILSQKRKAPVLRELFKDLGPAGTETNPRTCNAKVTFAVKPIMRRIPYDCLLFNGIGRPIDPDGYSRTITASAGGNMTLIVDDVFMHNPMADNWIQDYYDKLVGKKIKPEFKEAPIRLRRLTINETKRIQTFPDEYVFCGSKSSIYKQLGNAVPCEMAKTIAKAVVGYLQTLTKS